MSSVESVSGDPNSIVIELSNRANPAENFTIDYFGWAGRRYMIQAPKYGLPAKIHGSIHWIAFKAHNKKPGIFKTLYR